MQFSVFSTKKDTDTARQPKLLLIDGNSLLYRAFFALPPLTNAEGLPTNAVYGFTTMLLRLLEEERPTMVVVAFDKDKQTFRHLEYTPYKAQRARTPDDLIAQFPLAREMLQAMGIASLEEPGFEADDIIGTLACLGAQDGCEVLIVTGDQDALQLVDAHVTASIVTRGVTETRVYDEEAVRERFGFGPELMNDYRALKGDPSDNIPGVPGIGEKTAMSLIRQFGNIDNLFSHLDEVENARIRRILAEHEEDARLSKRLSTIRRDVPVQWQPEHFAVHVDSERLLETFRHLGFRTLSRRLLQEREEVVKAGEAALLPSVRPECVALREGLPQQASLLDDDGLIIASLGELAVFIDTLSQAHAVSLELLFSGPAAMTADLTGLSLASAECGGRYIPLAHNDGTSLEMRPALEALAPILESEAILKYGHGLKDQMVLLRRLGISLNALGHDSMVSAYLLNPSGRMHSLEYVAADHLNRGIPEYQQILGGGARAIPPGDMPSAVIGPLAVSRALAILDLIMPLSDRLKDNDLWDLYCDVDLPLLYVLTEMEFNGIAIDVPYLEALTLSLGTRILELEENICQLAGEDFNISSPRQLQHILFEKLHLPSGRKTKTGYSTDAHVLESLSDNPIVAAILKYRELTKLRSTYVDALPKMVNSETGRLHTSFNNTITSTGRLSSSNPNLQNIPVRTDLGKQIRRAFTAIAGFRLLKADYSQIELRVLAHLSGDQGLVRAFRAGEDIHTHTAADIYGVLHQDVTPDMRRVAKTVNFGLLYGMGGQRLARDLGISVGEAEDLINRYFERFPSVRGYMQNIVLEAHRHGRVKTLLGRVREIPEIHSRNRMLRAAAERAATNSPIQGTAADIIKIAMNNIYRKMKQLNLHSRLLLQIHDELLLEVRPDEAAVVAHLVKDLMETAVGLIVPLEVDLKIGNNWQDMETFADVV